MTARALSQSESGSRSGAATASVLGKLVGKHAAQFIAGMTIKQRETKQQIMTRSAKHTETRHLKDTGVILGGDHDAVKT